jgi:hypothetical protein
VTVAQNLDTVRRRRRSVGHSAADGFDIPPGRRPKIVCRLTRLQQRLGEPATLLDRKPDRLRLPIARTAASWTLAITKSVNVRP